MFWNKWLAATMILVFVGLRWESTAGQTDKAPADLTSDQRWAEWKEKGARQAARSARAMRLIWSIAVLALAIGFIWAFASR